MATYVTKKCPYCKNAYQVWKSGDQRKYGCPLITCYQCKKAFWDTDIKEPALYGYTNSHETWESTKAIITLIIMIPLSLALLGGGIWILVTDSAASGIFGLLMGGGLLWVCISFIKRNADDKKNMSTIIAKQQIGYDASLERLKNNDYLAALAEHDSKAKKLLEERKNGQTEHYALRPAYAGPQKNLNIIPEKIIQKRNNSDQIEELIRALYCNKCGAELSPNSIYCRKCGAPVQNVSSTRNS